MPGCILYAYGIQKYLHMIKSWKHKGLKRFFETGDASGINFNHVSKLKEQLLILDIANNPGELDLAGYGFHKLKGKLRNHYAISVNGGWRLIFCFESGDAILVDYLNYH